MYLAVENGRLFRNACICPHRRIVWVQLTRTRKRSNVGNTESERFCWGTYREVALPCLQPSACLPVCAWGAGVGRPLSALLALSQPLLGTHCGPRRVQRASVSAPAPPRALTWLPLTVGNGGWGWGAVCLSAVLPQIQSVAAFSEGLLSFSPTPSLHQPLCIYFLGGLSQPPCLATDFSHKHSAKACGETWVRSADIVCGWDSRAFWTVFVPVFSCLYNSLKKFSQFSLCCQWRLSPPAAPLRVKTIMGFFR